MEPPCKHKPLGKEGAVLGTGRQFSPKRKKPPFSVSASFFFFFFPFFLSPDTDHHSERSRPGGLKVPQAIFEGLLRNKERVIWPEKLVPGGLPAKLRGSGMWGYGSDQQLSLELCMPALVGGC